MKIDVSVVAVVVKIERLELTVVMLCLCCEMNVNTLRTGSFKLFKRPFPGFLTFLTL